MLEPPDIHIPALIEALTKLYPPSFTAAEFLPIGADQGTAVYRVVTDQSEEFFLKLRSGRFIPQSVTLPAALTRQGIPGLIAPVRPVHGGLWAAFNEYKTILYPFIDGQDGYTVQPTGRQWTAFGETLRRIHDMNLHEFTQHGTLLNEAWGEMAGVQGYSSRWRDQVWDFLKLVQDRGFYDPVGAKLAGFIQDEQARITHILDTASELAGGVMNLNLSLTLCHGDLHAGNLHLSGDAGMYIVDWDDAVLAPRERDLMAVGGGLMGGWLPPDEEEKHFYAGYGAYTVNPTATAYYRLERIIQDLAVYCEMLLTTNGGGDDRAVSLGYFKSNFEPGGTIDLAMAGLNRAL